MRFTSLFLALALLGIFHAPNIRNAASGTLPCYTDSGTLCGSTFHVIHDHTSLVTASDCAPLAECLFTTYKTWPPAAQFSNAYYACQATQIGVVYFSVEMDAHPLSGNQVAWSFLNTSGLTIPANTTINYAFTCEGI
jgi:hypothetical protein